MGPPLFPGLTVASVWRKRVSPSSFARAADREPAVTVTSGTTFPSARLPTSTWRPNGKPRTLTGLPASIASESPSGR